MRRLSLAELDARCQKLDHHRLGNWMARRVARPAALRVTWLIAPWPISAHVVTLAALGCAVAAAAAFGWGTAGGWLLGAILLQAWYLLDHVDGQVARLRQTESLDGVAFDYLMHHLVHLVVPLGIGWGVAVRTLEPWWLLAGLAWAAALLTRGLLADVRYKAFIQRLKRVRGSLEAVGGGGGRPQPAPPIPERIPQIAAWTAQKLCEMHVLANLLSLLALFAWAMRDNAMLTGRACLIGLPAVAVAVAARALLRSLREGQAEAEFSRWYRVGPDDRLEFDGQWWTVERNGARQGDGVADGSS